MHAFVRPTTGPLSAKATLVPRKARTLATSVATMILTGVLCLGAEASAASPTSKNQGLARVPNQEEEIFVEILSGELELRRGQPELAVRALSNAARKAKSDVLFQRSTEIAMRTGQGSKSLEMALGIAQTWQTTLPNSSLAPRYLVDILLRLGRGAEVVEPLSNLLKSASPSERLGWIIETPRILTSVDQPGKIASVLQSVLKPYADSPETGPAVQVALGRLWLNANEPGRAFEFAQKAHQMNPGASEPAILAMELMGFEPKASTIVESHLQKRPTNLGLRFVFARALSITQRNAEAIAQLETITSQRPDLPSPWLTLGTLQVELNNPKEAIIALRNYLDQIEKYGDRSPPTLTVEGDGSSGLTVNVDDQEGGTLEESRQRAWLLLSQASDLLGDQNAAQEWLRKVDDPRLAREVVQRQVTILGKQGKVAEARKLIRNLTDQQADDRTKVLLETLLLREVRNWAEAHKVLHAANQRIPNDIDLLYEQAMVEEKLNRLTDMERLLRRVIDLKPDHYNALNALGYTLADRRLRLPEAKTLIRRALDLAPGDPFITDSMGWVEYRLGNHKEALKLLRAAYKARPDAEISAHLGEVLWVSGQRDEALQIWKEGLKRDAHNEVLKETLQRLKAKP